MAEHEPTKATILKQVEVAKEQLDKISTSRARGAFSGFINFVREQGVVGLAIGLVLGVAAKSVVDSIVENIFNPLIGLLTGGINLADKSICLKHKLHSGVCQPGLAMNYGKLLSSIVSFMIVALVVYIVVKSLKLDRLDKKKA